MYQEHFGLKRAPFKITPDTSLFYSGAERGSVLEALIYAVMSGEGIIKVIGEVGTGKTMLCRMLEVRLPDEVQTVYIANPSLSPENILNVIAFELGLIKQPSNKLEVMQVLQNWLLEQHSQGRNVVVLIEEAQGVPLETLEEIRLLSNIETEQDKLMQIVLFGQPELDENLSKPSIRQLNERIAHGFYLSPLKKTQIKDYLNFRIRTAGYHGPDLFDEPVSKALSKHSKGLIRRVNILADKTLLAAFADGTTRLDRTHAKKAIKDSGFFSFRKIPKMVYAAGAAGLLLGLVSAGLVWWAEPEPLPSAVAAENTQTPTQNNALNKAEVATTSQTLVDKAKPETDSSAAQISASNTEPVAEQKEPATQTEEVLQKSSGDANAVELPINEVLDEVQGEAEILSEAGFVEENPEGLHARLNATENWLQSADEGQYSIQIMTVRRGSVENLQDFLFRLSKNINVEEIYVYRTVLNGQPMFGILYKTFNNRGMAVSALRDIPDELKEHRPFLLRTVKGVRNEIARSNG